MLPLNCVGEGTLCSRYKHSIFTFNVIRNIAAKPGKNFHNCLVINFVQAYVTGVIEFSCIAHEVLFSK